MRRSLAILASLLVLVGCQATTPATPTSSPVDPFFGRTRVEPPATGTVAKPGAIDPYYAASQAPQAPAAAAKAAPAAVTAPAANPAAAPQTPASNPVQPRSGSVPWPPLSQAQQPAAAATASTASPPRGDLVAIPASARQATDLLASRASSVGTAASTPITTGQASGQAASSPAARPAAAPRTFIQTLQPLPKSGAIGTQAPAALPSTWPAPQAVSMPQKSASAVETTPAPLAAAGRTVDPAVVPASATEPVAADSPAKPDSATPDNRYAHDPSYQCLRGKLEFSQIDKAWALRYIPSDGATDSYGGSVVLAMTPQLSGFERGQFVEVHGRLLPPTAGRKTYAAGYEISQIQRVGP